MPAPTRVGQKPAKKKANKSGGEGVDPADHENAGRTPPPPSDKERIVVSAHGMEPWEIYVPKGLSAAQWNHGLKMAVFILNHYRPSDAAAPAADNEEDVP